MAEYAHIPWRRLEAVSNRRRRQGFGTRRTFRLDVRTHGQQLSDALAGGVRRTQQTRRTLGIDPATLRVLQFDLLESSEREHLERLGLQIVDEQERTERIEPPEFVLIGHFASPELLNRFLADPSKDGVGIVRVERIRGSGGVPKPQDVELHFTDKEKAVAFAGSQELKARFQVEVRHPKPAKLSARKLVRVLVQFEDAAALSRFETELTAYQGTGAAAAAPVLSAVQRAELFDSLDQLAEVSPADRTGPRLTSEGLPTTPEFYIDVDLWHPGSAAAVAGAIQQFRDVVQRAGGRVTDAPHPVADTLLLARVKGSRATLEALVSYDRCVSVDLPPIVPFMEFSIFDPVTVPADMEPLPANPPLVCVIDSGIVAGHPLFRGSVIDEQDFDSGEADVADHVGHGTHVAGIAVFGDVQRCLQANQWIPRVGVISAKVLRAGPHGDAVFGDEKRAETQVREAVEHFVQARECRVFNLSIGNAARLYSGGRQLPMAQMLDELAREKDIVIVVSAGNVNNPGLPAAATATDFQKLVREQIFSEDHRIIDPATAVNCLTVGSIARSDVPQNSNPGHRPPPVGSPTDCPSPFTRCGLIESSGSGLRRTVKPEIVSFGGNLCVGMGNRWDSRDILLAEPSLKHDYQSGRLLTVECGTSVSAPAVAHICARVERRIEADSQRKPSANLVRALIANSAQVREATETWLTDGASAAEGRRRVLRAVGYGVPDLQGAMVSTDDRPVLVAEDEIAEDSFHLYALEIPQEFIDRPGRRQVTVSLAYDPPVRGKRKEYLSRTMWFKVYRGLAEDVIRAAMARAEGSGEQPELPAGNIVAFDPPQTPLEWSTLQSASFVAQRGVALDYRVNGDGPALWHVLVGCKLRFPVEITTSQRYALAVSLAHSDATVRLYQTLRQRITQRIRV